MADFRLIEERIDLALLDSPTTSYKTATGRARCRVCGDKIAKGDSEITFFYSFTDGSYNPWTGIECHIHMSCSDGFKAEYDQRITQPKGVQSEH